MSEWIKCSDCYPSIGQKIKIKSVVEEEVCAEGIAIFDLVDIDEHTEAIKWKIQDGYQSTLRPTHWMPLADPDALSECMDLIAKECKQREDAFVDHWNVKMQDE